MMLKSALVLVLAATLTGCAYDTYGNRGGNGNGNNSGRNSRNERAAYDSGYREIGRAHV